AAVLLAGPGPVRAEGDASARMTVFRESSKLKGNDGITVFHPQVDASGTLGSSLQVTAGWNADIVSGATPAVYGPVTGPDAISSATRFTDTRNAAPGGFDYMSGTVSLSAAYEYAQESDYKSHAVSVGARGDLFDRNLTLALAYTHNFDSVCNNNNTNVQGPLDLKPLPTSKHCFQNQPDVVTEPLDIDTLEPSLTWTATPRLLLQGGGTIQILDGFQSNPYRSVLVGNQHRTPQENEPRYRQRYAAFLRTAYALPALRASLSLMGRAYRDSWDVRAGTGEIDFQKYLATFLLLRVRGRYHQQTGAVFFRTGDEYRSKGPAGQYWSGDRELSPMHTSLFGGKLSYLQAAQQGQALLAVFNELELALKFDYLIYGLDSTRPVGPDCGPNGDRDHAVLLQVAFALKF